MQIQQNEKQYYIYALVDPRDKAGRYVGMSKDARMRLHQHLYKYKGSKRLLNWLEELDRLGLTPDLQILEAITDSDAYYTMRRERHP